MRSQHRRAHGFTLLEMMIVVAIIGILAAIALPAFQRYQSRSRRSEAYANLASLAKVEKAYFAEYSLYVSPVTGFQPGPGGGGLGTTKRIWGAAADADFAAIGWRPEGGVFYDYDVFVDAAACPALDCFTASAYGDADGNGAIAVISYTQPNSAGAVALEQAFGLPVPTDPATGQPRLNEVAVNHLAADLY
jgi:prepilin-type N-terminal cleavage/methylation domain-containing protein